VPAVDYSRTNHTLLVAVDPNCGICTGSMPFFKRLIEQSKDTGTQVVVIGKYSVDELNQYLGKHDVKDVKVVSVSLRDIKVSSVPTMLLADQRGRFAKMWVGGIADAEQEELLNELKRGWQ
jgi:peroxiredoxin